MKKENESAVQKYGSILEKKEEYIKHFKGEEKKKIESYYGGMQVAYIEYCTKILDGKLYTPEPTLGGVIATGGESYKVYKENIEVANASRLAISKGKANVEDYYQVIVQMLEEKNLYTRLLSPEEKREKRLKMFKEEPQQFSTREKMYVYFYDISNFIGYVGIICMFVLPFFAFGMWMAGFDSIALISILIAVGLVILSRCFLRFICKEPEI